MAFPFVVVVLLYARYGRSVAFADLAGAYIVYLGEHMLVGGKEGRT